MPKIGTMTEIADDKTGEITAFAGACDIPELRKFRCQPNERGQSENAPAFLVMVAGREMGAMWNEGEDRRGREYFAIKCNGYPLKSEIWMRAFKEDDGSFNLDYSAPRAAKGGEA